jgi:hypothetical protein
MGDALDCLSELLVADSIKIGFAPIDPGFDLTDVGKTACNLSGFHGLNPLFSAVITQAKRNAGLVEAMPGSIEIDGSKGFASIRASSPFEERSFAQAIEIIARQLKLQLKLAARRDRRR